jgi:hypothetical protein
MFSLMLPWLIISCLLGVVLGLVLGISIASSLVRHNYHHFQSMQAQSPTQPLSDYRRGPVQYLDDEPFGRPHR